MDRHELEQLRDNIDQALALLKQPKPSDIELCIPSDCYVVVENEGLKQELDWQTEENKELHAKNKELQASTCKLYASLDTEHIKQVLKLETKIEILEREYELFGCPKCPEFKSCQFAEKCRQCWNLGEMAREVKERQALSDKPAEKPLKT